MSPPPICGPGVVVEPKVDEEKFDKRKYTKGSYRVGVYSRKPNVDE